jgi:phosphohistidine phosphatase
MKRLILLRHAKSSWRDATLGDLDRPLSERGERDAPRMGARLRQHGAAPHLVLTSHAERARRTATVVARELDYPQEHIRVVPQLYMASPAEVLAVLSAQDPRIACLLVVGHNPGLTELVNLLLPNLGLDNVPTGGVIAIDFDTDEWPSVTGAPHELVFYDYPKNPQPVAPARKR